MDSSCFSLCGNLGFCFWLTTISHHLVCHFSRLQQGLAGSLYFLGADLPGLSGSQISGSCGGRGALGLWETCLARPAPHGIRQESTDLECSHRLPDGPWGGEGRAQLRTSRSSSLAPAQPVLFSAALALGMSTRSLFLFWVLVSAEARVGFHLLKGPLNVHPELRVLSPGDPPSSLSFSSLNIWRVADTKETPGRTQVLATCSQHISCSPMAC